MLTIDETVRHLRSQPQFADLVRDAYLGVDVLDSAKRFRESGEFAEVTRLLRRLQPTLQGAAVVDLGAGTGIASRAFSLEGATAVYALEPDPSGEVGQGAIRRFGDSRIHVVSAFGENLPLASNIADVVYARQVLHHTRDLDATLKECARILRPGGIFLACREHVANSEAELTAFLAAHPVHQLAGGEHAYPLTDYLGAIARAGLSLQTVMGPWDSVINSFPSVQTRVELETFASRKLSTRFGLLGRFMAALPGVQRLVRARTQLSAPGAIYSFLALKP